MNAAFDTNHEAAQLHDHEVVPQGSQRKRSDTAGVQHGPSVIQSRMAFQGRLLTLGRLATALEGHRTASPRHRKLNF